ncbi:MAG TPA: ABC transporter permease [Candidatus Limnocylindrales bacterium]|nr:ABC transporter permease [Candidatus Limnocylindrales bacterium]
MLALAMRAASGNSFAAFLALEVRRALRNRRYVIFTIAFPVILYVLYTAVIPASGDGTIRGVAWNLFFLVSMATYGAIGASMSQATPIAVERVGGWITQLRTTPLASSAYVLAKLVSAVLLTIPALVLVALAGIAVNHVALPPARLLELVLTLAIGALPFAALGIVIGYTLDADSAQGGMVLTFFGMAILGGLFAPVDAFPEPLATIATVLPSYHLAAVGRSVVAGALPAVGDALVLAAWTVGGGVVAAWRFAVAGARARG